LYLIGGERNGAVDGGAVVVIETASGEGSGGDIALVDQRVEESVW
jgi:hypothetical protein